MDVDKIKKEYLEIAFLDEEVNLCRVLQSKIEDDFGKELLVKWFNGSTFILKRIPKIYIDFSG